MPTIEIVSINCESLNLKQEDFDVAIIEENKLESHRGLFYDFILKQSGTIIHIGNADLKEDKEGGFFGGMLINWDFEPTEIFIPEYDPDEPLYNGGANQQYKFQFEEKYKPDIDTILKSALHGSPIRRIFFLTDYQFGPENGNKEIIYTISDFWAQHDNEGLVFNTLYEMYGE